MNSIAFRSGLALPLALALLAPASHAQGSDACSTAQVIAGAGPHAFDTSSATTGSEGQSDPACIYNMTATIQNDVWFRWTATATGTFFVSSCQQTTVDTKISVYAGTSCPPGGSIGCDDDACGVQSLAPFAASSGSTYTIQVGNSVFGGPGTGDFRILLAPNAAADDCNLSPAIAGTGFFAFDNSGAATGTQGQSNPFCGAIIRDVWFDWTAPVSGLAQFDTCGQTPNDSEIAAYPGTGCPGATTNFCDDDGCGLQSIVQFPVSAGSPYILQIGGQSILTMSYGTIRIDVTPIPANDSCSTPAAANQGGVQYDSTMATTGSQGQTNPCGGIERDLWYTWTASVNGTAQFDTCFQTALNTSLAVYAGAGCPAGLAIACNDQGCGGMDQSEVTIPVTLGATYTIQIGSSPGFPGGPASISILETPGASPMTKSCFPGTGGVIACPCGQPANPAGGCANFGSGATTGAVLDATGTASLAADSVVLQTTNHRTPPPAGILNVFFSGQGSVGTGVPNGAGVRCVSTTLKRLYNGQTVAGSLSKPGMGDPSVSARSAALGVPISAGQTRHYFNVYRDTAATGPCGNTASNVNTTNAGSITWGP